MKQFTYFLAGSYSLLTWLLSLWLVLFGAVMVWELAPIISSQTHFYAVPALGTLVSQRVAILGMYHVIVLVVYYLAKKVQNINLKVLQTVDSSQWLSLLFISAFVGLFFSWWYWEVLVVVAIIHGWSGLFHTQPLLVFPPALKKIATKLHIHTVYLALIVLLAPVAISSISGLVGLQVMWLCGAFLALVHLSISLLTPISLPKISHSFHKPNFNWFGELSWLAIVLSMLQSSDQIGFFFGAVLFATYLLKVFILSGTL